MIRLTRVLILLLPCAALAGLVLVDLRLSEVHRAIRAKQLLLADQLGEAGAAYAGLHDSLWNRAVADAGTSVVLALRPDAGDYGPSGRILERQILRRMPNRVLLSRSLTRGDFPAVLRLADLLLENGLEPIAALYKASSLLELGEPTEAAHLYARLSDVIKDCELGKRVRRILDLQQTNLRTVIYDRRGRFLGSKTGAGQLLLAGDLEPDLVPAEAFRDSSLDQTGRSLRLGIDLELSRIARAALRGYRGSIVLLDTVRGDVLAAVCQPSAYGREGFPPFHQLREPASISKVITATAFLRAGFDADSAISHSYCSGAERYRGGILYCPCRNGALRGLDHALAVSCNIAFADLGVRVGRERLLDELTRYGFGRTEQSGLEFGRVLAERGDQRQLADLSIGLEATGITPVHAALLAATFGNSGVMPEPTLVHAEDGLLGLSPRLYPVREGRRVLDPAWLPVMLSAMESVTGIEGSAAGVVPSGFRFAMKTGTGADARSGYHTNYIGIGPLPRPKIAFCVRITHQKTSLRVRRASLTVTRRLLRGIVDAERWIPSLTELAGSHSGFALPRQDLASN